MGFFDLFKKKAAPAADTNVQPIDSNSDNASMPTTAPVSNDVMPQTPTAPEVTATPEAPAAPAPEAPAAPETSEQTPPVQ